MFVYNFNRVFEVNCPLKVNKNTIPLCMGGKSTPRAQPSAQPQTAPKRSEVDEITSLEGHAIL